ncbi:MAG: RidA family protein [Emcibacter sp.]|nr:RidA family protein [Emcibacter sp.]
MVNIYEKNLEKLGFVLPTPTKPVANYLPFVKSGNIVSISGQIPFDSNGKLPYLGKVGDTISQEDAIKAAQLCAINIISQAKMACDGDLNRVVRIIKLGAFVNCIDGFAGQPNIINGASDLMVAVFGEKGKHSRSAVGTNALPLNVPVEIDALIEIS